MNEIEFPADRIDYRERDAANADDASTIRARARLGSGHRRR